MRLATNRKQSLGLKATYMRFSRCASGTPLNPRLWLLAKPLLDNPPLRNPLSLKLICDKKFDWTRPYPDYGRCDRIWWHCQSCGGGGKQYMYQSPQNNTAAHRFWHTVPDPAIALECFRASVRGIWHMMDTYTQIYAASLMWVTILAKKLPIVLQFSLN